jgi:hypothetical protein
MKYGQEIPYDYSRIIPMPIVGSIKEMDKRIFNDRKMGTRDDIVRVFNALWQS